jgi:DNA-binding transcriptional regulator YdaS (Cro superfamily)
MEPQEKALHRAIDVVGGHNALVRKIRGLPLERARRDTSKFRGGHVSYWKKHGRVTAEWVIAVEQATGGQVSRFELRPDIYPTEQIAS